MYSKDRYAFFKSAVPNPEKNVKNLNVLLHKNWAAYGPDRITEKKFIFLPSDVPVGLVAKVMYA